MTSNGPYTYQEILYYDWHAQAENDINNIAYPRIWKRLVLENCMRVFHLSKYQHKGCKQGVRKTFKQISFFIRFLLLMVKEKKSQLLDMSRPLSAGGNLVVPQDCGAGEHFKQMHTQHVQHRSFVEPRRTSGEAARKIFLAVSLPSSAFVTQANAHPPHSSLHGSTRQTEKVLLAGYNLQ